MSLLDRLALDTLRRHGYRVFPPPPPPCVDSVWTPQRTKSAPRMVFGICDGRVSYAVPLAYGSAVEHTVTLSTWHRWVQRTNAQVVT